MNEITITEAAKIRGVDKSTIWRWIKRYNLTAKQVGWIWLVDADAVKNFNPPTRRRRRKK